MFGPLNSNNSGIPPCIKGLYIILAATTRRRGVTVEDRNISIRGTCGSPSHVVMLARRDGNGKRDRGRKI